MTIDNKRWKTNLLFMTFNIFSFWFAVGTLMQQGSDLNPKVQNYHQGGNITSQWLAVINLLRGVLKKKRPVFIVFYYRGERIVFWRPNTNTNNIRKKFATEYEYEYYSSICFHRIRIRIIFVNFFPPNTNTNIIRPENITEYEYE